MIDVSVNTFFLEDSSSPEDSIYIWGYNIKIINNYNYAVKLVRKYLQIIDSIGQKQMIDGPGLFLNDFLLLPGAKFELPGGIVLSSPSGVMDGYLSFSNLNDEIFEIHLPVISLDSEYDVHSLQ